MAEKKRATDQFIYDLCAVLAIARQGSGNKLPPDWQKLWDANGCGSA